MIPAFTWRARLALALAIALNRPWAWLTLAAHYKGPPALLNREQRRKMSKRYKASPPL